MRVVSQSYDSYEDAARAVDALERAGVPHSDITLISGDQTRSAGTTTDSDAATGAGTGATVGTVLGGGAGLLAGIGALAIPGVGPIVAAGWLVATLTGAGVGAAAGGLLGSLTGAGIDEADAQRYAEHVGRGGTLVSVRASDDTAAQAQSILQGGGSLTSGSTYGGATTGGLGSGYAGGTARSDLSDNPLTRGADDVLGTNMSGERPDQSDGTPANPPGTMVSRGVDKTLGTNISGANPGHESLGSGPTSSSYAGATPRGSEGTSHPVTRAADDTFGTNMSGERPDQADGTPANPPGTMASRGVDKTLGTNISGANPGHKVG